MRKIVSVGALAALFSGSAWAGPDWTLLEEGATALGQARVWIEACEAEQLGRLDGLLDQVRLVLENAGLQEQEIFRFETIVESSATLASGEGDQDCRNTEPRGRIGTAVQLVNQGIAIQ